MSALSRKEQRTARADRCSFLLPLLSESCVQEGAPCAGGAPRPRNPLPPSLIGGWARKVKKLYRAPVSATGPQRGPASSRTERALRAPSVRPPGAARPNAPAGPCGAAVRALAPPVKKARPSPSGAARPCLFSGAAAPRSSPRRCSGPKIGPVRWWPYFGPSAPNGPPGSAPPAGGPFGRSRPVPLALRYHLRRAGGRGHRRRRGKLPPVGPAGPAI